VEAASSAGNGVSWSDGGSGSEFADECSMSSAEWLGRHGILARRLGFYDVLAGAAFKHEDGVLDLKVAPPCRDDEVVDAVSRSQIPLRYLVADRSARLVADLNLHELVRR